MQTFTRGETLLLAVQNLDNVTFTSAAAKLKAAVDSMPSGSSLLDFTVTYAADLGADLGPGWLLKATPTQSLALEPGMYITDLRIVLSTGDVEITVTELIKILAGVTETA